MFYRKESNGNWNKGLIIYLPKGEILSIDNTENNEGWVWYDEAPAEFVKWIDSMKQNSLIKIKTV